MPLKTFLCKCGNRFTDLTSISTPNPDFGKCPNCLAQATEAPVELCSHKCDRDDFKDPLEVEAALSNRKMHEDMIISGSRDLGEFNVKESGPDWTRPFGNNTFDRNQAIANAKVNTP